jgi:tRNA-Thr(GGU) m(6)t(6)A37 methyltransferase TsaA
MADADDSISITPIGYVRSRFAGYAPSDEMREYPSEIVVRPEFAAGLMGLEPGIHILTLFVLHRASERGYELRLHPGHNPENPIRGVFATRSQYRPNYIAATVATISGIEVDAESGQATLTVTGLDAQDGSPVVDIKPHSPGFDGIPGSG